MLLGKRSRQPIKRTTSMTGMTVDVSDAEDVVSQEPLIITDPPPQNPLHEFPNANCEGYDQRFLAMVSPRNLAAASGRSSSSSFNYDRHHAAVDTTAPFLRSCCLCRRRLALGRDIYMYRGDTAFCSLECREQQMKQDERKEKLKAIGSSKKEDRHASSSNKASNKTEPALAAA